MKEVQGTKEGDAFAFGLEWGSGLAQRATNLWGCNLFPRTFCHCPVANGLENVNHLKGLKNSLSESKTRVPYTHFQLHPGSQWSQSCSHSCSTPTGL